MDNKERALSAALRYIGFKMRTEKETGQYLVKKGFSEEVIQETLEILRDYRYLDDQEFAGYWVRDRFRYSGHGRYRIIGDLRKKGIHKGILDDAIQNFISEEEEEAKILELYRKKNPDNLPMTEKELYRLYQFFLRRGFPDEKIRKILLRNHPDCDS